MTKPLKIPKGKGVKGLYVHCFKCKKSVMGGKCGLTQKRLSTCKHADKHAFRAKFAVPGTNGSQRPSKTFETRELNEAIKLAIDFEDELKSTDYRTDFEKEQPVRMPMLVVECQAMYIGYLNNVGVVDHKRKQRSSGHIKEVERFFRYFCQMLKHHGYNHLAIRVDQLTDKIVGHTHSYIKEELGYKNKTYNKYIGCLRGWLQWLIDHKGYQMENRFVGVSARPTLKKQKSITKGQFTRLLEVITPENGTKIESSGYKRVHYRPWMRAAFMLALETGLRREELFTLSWDSIVFDEAGKPLCFEIDNYKVNRLAGLDPGEEGSQVKMVPITRGLLRLLKEELEWRKYVGTPHFLLGPESNLRRKTMWEGASRAFGHFWSLTGYEQELELNDLRNTFITRLTMAHPEHAKVISDHASIEVIKKHYTDQNLLATVTENFTVFS